MASLEPDEAHDLARFADQIFWLLAGNLSATGLGNLYLVEGPDGCQIETVGGTVVAHDVEYRLARFLANFPEFSEHLELGYGAMQSLQADLENQEMAYELLVEASGVLSDAATQLLAAWQNVTGSRFARTVAGTINVARRTKWGGALCSQAGTIAPARVFKQLESAMQQLSQADAGLNRSLSPK